MNLKKENHKTFPSFFLFKDVKSNMWPQNCDRFEMVLLYIKMGLNLRPLKIVQYFVTSWKPYRFYYNLKLVCMCWKGSLDKNSSEKKFVWKKLLQ